ncbi:hypothetical protein BGZ63DRAFT_173448 [Mariannaea sp. PMI_226]|nr:hypothetical protein BGZ63DRAFT_173448 [Mariannaea sp. PMI_226]
MVESLSVKRLHMDDANRTGSQRRRAASPQIDHLLATQPDLLRCRDVGSKLSPTLYLNIIPQGLSNSYMSFISTISTPGALGSCLIASLEKT